MEGFGLELRCGALVYNEETFILYFVGLDLGWPSPKLSWVDPIAYSVEVDYKRGKLDLGLTVEVINYQVDIFTKKKTTQQAIQKIQQTTSHFLTFHQVYLTC